jgi:putative SOS response-associated peptidase YedK
MCYSAQVYEGFKKYVRLYGADIDIHQYVKLYVDRRNAFPVKIPKAMDANFYDPQTPEERQVKGLIDEWNAAEEMKWQTQLFAQTKRLNDAERTLLTKITKKATEDKRIATDKISRAKLGIEDINRTELKERDSRIFPQWYSSILVAENGKRVLKPMRYQCRLEGMPATSDYTRDRQLSGTYNARRDNLERFWRKQFGYSHGIMVVSTFYENVEGEDGKNRVLQFTPKDGSEMLVACLWSHWKDPAGREPDLLSYAAITDEPEPEVAAAGHDRTIINIKPEHVDAWLNPDPSNLQALYDIFDDKQHPYYEHKLEKAA